MWQQSMRGLSERCRNLVNVAQVYEDVLTEAAEFQRSYEADVQFIFSHVQHHWQSGALWENDPGILVLLHFGHVQRKMYAWQSVLIVIGFADPTRNSIVLRRRLYCVRFPPLNELPGII